MQVVRLGGGTSPRNRVPPPGCASRRGARSAPLRRLDVHFLGQRPAPPGAAAVAFLNPRFRSTAPGATGVRPYGAGQR